MRRVVEPEILDGLSPVDPRAEASRGDLRRLNVIMGHSGILSRALRRPLEAALVLSRPLRVVELGAGDGTLLLRLARRWSATGLTAEVTLLDRQNLVSMETRDAFAALNWPVECVAIDVLAWLEQSPSPVDLMLANLFLHHFQDNPLRALLRLIGMKTNLFIACEPRRSRLSLTASRYLGLLGCSAVTRHDAVVSVRAGFVDNDLTALWTSETPWELSEHSAGLFSHCFVAKRHG